MSEIFESGETLLSDAEKAEIDQLESTREKFEKEVIRKFWKEAESERRDNEGFRALEAGSQLGAQNIAGVGIAEQVRGGRGTGKLAITVYTEFKASPENVKDDCLMPATFEGVPINVVQTGFVTIQQEGNPRARYRPTKCGISVGHYSITAGTLGCICSTSKEDKLILSNNHVLAASSGGKKGDDILQPGAMDSGNRNRDKIGELFDFKPIDFGGGDNWVDAGLARPTLPLENVDPEIKEIGKVRGFACNAGKFTPVKKSGRTTGFTEGYIEGVNVTAPINFRVAGNPIFKGLYTIKPSTGYPNFSRGGDSGSLILDNSNRAVALLFAGSSAHTLALPICTVMNALGITRIL